MMYAVHSGDADPHYQPFYNYIYRRALSLHDNHAGVYYMKYSDTLCISFFLTVMIPLYTLPPFLTFLHSYMSCI